MNKKACLCTQGVDLVSLRKFGVVKIIIDSKNVKKLKKWKNCGVELYQQQWDVHNKQQKCT